MEVGASLPAQVHEAGGPVLHGDGGPRHVLPGHLQQQQQPLDGHLRLEQVRHRLVDLLGPEGVHRAEDGLDVGLAQRRHAEADLERRGEVHAAQHVAVAGGAHHKEFPTRRRHALHQHQQRLEHRVGEARPDGDVLQQPLEVVQHDDGQRRLVRVVKDLGNAAALGLLREAHHVVAGDDLHEGKPALHRNGGGQRRRAAPHRPVQQQRHQWRLLAALTLLHQHPRSVEQVREGIAVRDDAVQAVRLQRGLVRAKRRLHLVERRLKILHRHLEVVLVHGLAQVRDVDLPVQRERDRALHQPLDLRSREVLRALCQADDIHILPQERVFQHLVGVDFKDLLAALLVRQPDLHVHLQAPRAQQRLVQHVLAVGHADEQDVVQGVNSVDLGEQLVDERVVHAGAVFDRAALLADGVNLVKDDDVQLAVFAASLVLRLRIRKQRTHVLLTLPDVLVQDLGTVHNLGLLAIEHLADLPRDECLARARRPVQQHALHVRDAQLLDHLWREHARREGAAEDIVKLSVQAADPQLLKGQLLGLEDLVGHHRALVDDLDARAAVALEQEG
mmetsp:Transcript_18438/g.48130  ORF Transcript_18438/g.48130 Transcript_18438/m.48130 type:complete len:560 (-) Transcript_18438:737-2416(-)